MLFDSGYIDEKPELPYRNTLIFYDDANYGGLSGLHSASLFDMNDALKYSSETN